jgi:hypothetical protein
MCIRAYMVVDTVGGKSQQLVNDLRRKQGVVHVDLLEGSPDLIIVVEAAERGELVGFIMKVLESVTTITKDLRFFIAPESALPARVTA